MLRIEKESKTLSSLDKVTMPDSGITERYDLQRMICNSPDVFFKEMSEDILLIGEEVKPTEHVDNRIDLLGIDRDGNVVVIELKRGSNKLQLLQALSYAAMMSDWQPEDIASQYKSFRKINEPEEGIEQFIAEDIDSLNSAQRIILIAEDYDYEVLVTAEWLTNFYGVNIKCYRLGISKESNGNEYMACTCIFPPPEISQHVTKRGRKKASTTDYPNDWDDVFASIQNEAVREFFRQELAEGRENYVKHKDLYFRLNDKRLFFVGARTKNAYVWQYKRFENDIEYWQDKLGPHIDIQEVKDGESLRFFLSTKEDFKTFKECLNDEILGEKFKNM